MRAPDAPGTPVNGARRAVWLGRFQGYRVNVGEAQIDQWMGQFEEEHKDVAARVLDAVEYVTDHDMEDALRAVLQELPGWHRDADQRQGTWRFVAFGPPGSSGDTMLHRFKLANDLDWPTYEELFVHKSELLLQGLGAEDTVVFIDDFAGSGSQVCSAWKTSLQELLPDEPKSYLVLVGATDEAVNRISGETKLTPRARHVFVAADNLFSDACLHFSQAEKAALLEYCAVADKKQPRGYGECGLLVVLAHRCPNNAIPILHACQKKFRGLFPRS